MINCFYDCYRILNKVYGEKTFIKQAINSVDIEELNRALTVKITYGVLDKDIELSYIISKLAEKSPKRQIRIILKIAMYSIKFLNKKPYAVIDNAVELVKKLGKEGASGFTNAFLRKYVETYDKIEYPSDIAENISIRYSYPLFAVKSLIKDYGIDRTKSILSSDYPLLSLSFYGVDGEKYLKEKNIEYYKTPFENVFNVKNFTRNEDYDKGLYTFQALGSVAICDVIEPCENILDCCAAPGGKSVRLSYKCKNVISWDVHEHRVKLINEYASRMKVKNIKAYTVNAKEYNRELNGKFDAVLVDSPCSGLGVAFDNPDIKLNRTKEDIDFLLNDQRDIINSVCNYVKVGGYLYYSTCSIISEENILRIKAFLKNHKNYKLENIVSKLPHENIDGTVQFLPDISCGQGFFVAKLKKER